MRVVRLENLSLDLKLVLKISLVKGDTRPNGVCAYVVPMNCDDSGKEPIRSSAEVARYDRLERRGVLIRIKTRRV